MRFHKLFIWLLCLFFSHVNFAQRTLLPIRFSQSPKPAAPVYNNTNNWAALPDRNDQADKAPRKFKDLQSTAAADVFYVHPTTYTGKPDDSFQWNADVKNKGHNKNVDESPIYYQASVFNGSCKVYAPRYRQAHYYCFITPYKEDKQAALDLAYSDVKAAFEYYLINYNHGRPIVIAAHSQGTIHAARLLRDFFQDKRLQSQLVVAYLVGMPVTLDSFPHILPCRDSSQTGCYVSWRTYERGYVPSWKAGDASRLVCHNPISWEMDTTYVSKLNHQGAVLRNFNKPLPCICDAQVHEGYLWITKPKFPGSKFYHNPNYHIGDYNLFYLDIRKNVADRIAAYSLK